MIKFFTQNEYQYGRVNFVLSISLCAGLFILFCVQSVAFANEPVPPGFARLPNGDIKVSDPTTAFAPQGYRINAQGILVKSGEVIASTEFPEDPEVTTNHSSDQSTEQADSGTETSMKIDEVLPGFHRMPNGDMMANSPSTAVAPEGYRLTEGGVLEPLKDEPLSEESSEDETSQSSKQAIDLEELPPGFHQMPNGDIMANSPSTAVAPEGYRLTEGGILKRIDDTSPDETAVSNTTEVAALEEIPPGYHQMPDGTLMANNPSTAVAPPGYHLMPDGTLMANNGGSIDHFQHHSHGGGMWMFDYQVEQMYMEGFRDTTTKISPQQVLSDYPYTMAPTDMTMDMYMFMLMYHSRDYMVMVMAHYMANQMGMLSSDTTKSSMESDGPGDTIVTISYQWKRYLAFVGGISLPTGSTDARGPMQHTKDNIDLDFKYPYGMQLGSGTYDLKLGANYTDTKGSLAWGADYEYTLRTGTNSDKYTLGNVMLLGSWVKYNLTREFTALGKMQLRSVGQIDGVDPELDQFRDMSPTFNASNYGGDRIDVGFALRYENNKMTSFGFEFTAPVYQDLYGPQMSTEWIVGLTVGLMF